MRRLSYTVPGGWDGAAAGSFLRIGLGLSARALAGVKYSGELALNGTPCHTGVLLHTGDLLELTLPEENSDYPPAELPLDIAYEDRDLLIVRKPAGMPVHPSPGHGLDSLLNAAAWHYRLTGQRGRIRPLYRLDKDTSGLLPLAKHKIAAGARLQKRYLAVCEGGLEGSGTVNAPIGLRAGSKIVRQVRPDGQSSLTRWRALAQAPDRSHTLLSLDLLTGRTHQIRVHMAYLGHPLAGDDLYGGSLSKISRQALHMGWLRANCLALRMDMELRWELPEDIRRAFPWVEDVSLEDKNGNSTLEP